MKNTVSYASKIFVGFVILTAIYWFADAATITLQKYLPQWAGSISKLSVFPSHSGSAGEILMHQLTAAFRGGYEELTVVALIVLLARRYGISMQYAAGISILFRIAIHLDSGVGISIIKVGFSALVAVIFYMKANSLFPLWLAHFVHSYVVNYPGESHSFEAPYVFWWKNTGSGLIALVGIGIVVALIIHHLVPPPGYAENDNKFESYSVRINRARRADSGANNHEIDNEWMVGSQDKECAS